MNKQKKEAELLGSSPQYYYLLSQLSDLQANNSRMNKNIEKEAIKVDKKSIKFEK